MNYEELLEYLDLENAGDFQYFEAMADLIESEEYIESDAVYKLLEGADMATVSQITDDYFEDILDGLPDDAGEIYSLLHQIKMSLIGMMNNIEDESDIRKLADQLYDFRNWFSEQSDVELIPEAGGAPVHQCLRDAVTSSRMEKLGGDQYRYDFEGALDYELDDYVFSFAELMAAEDYDEKGTIEFDPENQQYS